MVNCLRVTKKLFSNRSYRLPLKPEKCFYNLYPYGMPVNLEICEGTSENPFGLSWKALSMVRKLLESLSKGSLIFLRGSNKELRWERQYERPGANSVASSELLGRGFSPLKYCYIRHVKQKISKKISQTSRTQ